MVKCDKTNRRKTLDEFALEAEGNEEEASLSLFERFAACVRPDFEQRSASIDYAQVAAQTSPETSELGGPRSREDGRPDHRACLPPPERNVLARPRILARHVCHHRRSSIRHII